MANAVSFYSSYKIRLAISAGWGWFEHILSCKPERQKCFMLRVHSPDKAVNSFWHTVDKRVESELGDELHELPMIVSTKKWTGFDFNVGAGRSRRRLSLYKKVLRCGEGGSRPAQPQVSV